MYDNTVCKFTTEETWWSLQLRVGKNIQIYISISISIIGQMSCKIWARNPISCIPKVQVIFILVFCKIYTWEQDLSVADSICADTNIACPPCVQNERTVKHVMTFEQQSAAFTFFKVWSELKVTVSLCEIVFCWSSVTVFHGFLQLECCWIWRIQCWLAGNKLHECKLIQG